MLTAKLLGNVRNTGWGCVGASTATGNAGCAVAEELAGQRASGRAVGLLMEGM